MYCQAPLSMGQRSKHSRLDLAADSSVPSAFIWDCTATLANGILSGTTEISVAAGQSEVTFDDLTVEQPGLSYDIDIICITTDGNQTLQTLCGCILFNSSVYFSTNIRPLT